MICVDPTPLDDVIFFTKEGTMTVTKAGEKFFVGKNPPYISLFKKDDQAVIEALEGLEMANSLGHAQGGKLLRKEDHSGIIDCYISRIENDELHVKKTVSRAEMAKTMPVRFDLSKMPL